MGRRLTSNYGGRPPVHPKSPPILLHYPGFGLALSECKQWGSWTGHEITEVYTYDKARGRLIHEYKELKLNANQEGWALGSQCRWSNVMSLARKVSFQSNSSIQRRIKKRKAVAVVGVFRGFPDSTAPPKWFRSCYKNLKFSKSLALNPPKSQSLRKFWWYTLLYTVY